MIDGEHRPNFDEKEFTQIGAERRDRWLREIAAHTTIEGRYTEIHNFLSVYLTDMELSIHHLLRRIDNNSEAHLHQTKLVGMQMEALLALKEMVLLRGDGVEAYEQRQRTKQAPQSDEIDDPDA